MKVAGLFLRAVPQTAAAELKTVSRDTLIRVIYGSRPVSAIKKFAFRRCFVYICSMRNAFGVLWRETLKTRIVTADSRLQTGNLLA
jgi:hypothetical protein